MKMRTSPHIEQVKAVVVMNVSLGTAHLEKQALVTLTDTVENGVLIRFRLMHLT